MLNEISLRNCNRVENELNGIIYDISIHKLNATAYSNITYAILELSITKLNLKFPDTESVDANYDIVVTSDVNRSPGPAYTSYKALTL